jgi:trk system potassium uptake protein TrkA
MRAIIVGAGEVGFHVAERLSRQGHDIVVVDASGDRLEHVQSRLDVEVVEGNGGSPLVMDKAGVDGAELLVAVTNVDEVNLVTCMVSRGRQEMTKVARVSNPDFYVGRLGFDPSRYGVDIMISPERALAIDTFRLLESTVATDIAVFADGRLQVISLPVLEAAPVVGKTMAEIAKRVGGLPMLVAAIERHGEAIIPTGATGVETGDQLYLVVTDESLTLALHLCGHERATLHRAMIAGGTYEAYYLATLLAKHHVQATLIVDDRTRAHEMAESLDKALVLHGDATDVELLEMEGVAEADAFVALTEHDQDNILSSLVAKHAGAKQVVTLVNRIEYIPVARGIGLDATVSPRLSVANAIMGHVHRGSIKSISAFKDMEAEAISFSVSAECPLVGRSLAEIDFPSGAIVAAISRGADVIVPRGTDSVEAGDYAVVFALPDVVEQVKELFPG